MDDYKYLSNIQSPDDVKKLNKDELNILADEIRKELITTVSKTGGHLASNLGVVELTVALHKVFNSPNDKIVWDVGHQSYVHKLLTGRFEEFDTLRQEHGLSGFTRPDESEHDIFFSGHSSVALSAALGVATANKIKGKNDYTIAVVGDGAFTGGEVYEAMNNAGKSKTKLIVIFNDNNMSISQNVGALAKYFAKVRSNPRYFRLKARTEKIINYIPFVGVKISNAIFRLKTKIKNLIYNSTIFEDLGFRYMGPIYGHDIPALIDALEGAKAANIPVMLHIKTVKGKGYTLAEQHPSEFHGISQFDPDTGERKSSSPDYSAAFGDYLVSAASNDKRICAVTAAMGLSTGLNKFAEKFPSRFFDVGIAEQHAVTFCAGLSRGGMVPVFAVYSSFLQRTYDQIVHDGTLQRLHMILAIDRAGFVGADGETHNGLLDVAMLNSIPETTIYAPASFAEMRNCFYKALYKEKGLVAVRYNRGSEIMLPNDFVTLFGDYDIYGNDEHPVCIVTYGRTFAFAAAALKDLSKKGINAFIVKLNRIKPLPDIFDIVNNKSVFFFEEGQKLGGIAETLSANLLENGFKGKYLIKAVDDEFVMHAEVSSQLHAYGLDTEGVINFISKNTDIEKKMDFEDEESDQTPIPETENAIEKLLCSINSNPKNALEIDVESNIDEANEKNI
jgi:1-deoxy-D-xylulose-5-phosphate synthase